MIMHINSAANSKIKYIRSLSQRKSRIKNRQYTVEGIRSVSEALLYGNTDTLVVTEDCGKMLPTDKAKNIYIVPEYIFEKISETSAPPGALAVLNMTDILPDMNKSGAYIYCDNIRDPGNLGTIIRTADSAGFDGVLLSPDCVDCYNPKTIRACMGSFFRMNIYENINMAELSEYKIYAGILDGCTKDYREVSYSGGIIIAIGNEANGISEENKKYCTGIKIPIYGNAESLNAAVAAALMMYEAANSRRK